MPRYVYRCDSCLGHFQIRHGMSEKQEECTICNSVGFLVRVPQMPFTVKKDAQEVKVGETTKDFIEQNKELIQTMKQEARNTTYDN